VIFRPERDRSCRTCSQAANASSPAPVASHVGDTPRAIHVVAPAAELFIGEELRVTAVRIRRSAEHLGAVGPGTARTYDEPAESEQRAPTHSRLYRQV
jgi:hypothetical protein